MVSELHLFEELLLKIDVYSWMCVCVCVCVCVSIVNSTDQR